MSAEILKQVEYYLSDANLARDKFFNEKIRDAGADGWIDLQNILNCNKVKAMPEVKGAASIVAAVATSTQVEVDESGTKIRRKGDKPVPALVASSKKRDFKAGDKEEQKDEKRDSDALPALDERGNPVLSNNDFENPIIVHFKTPVTEGSDFKVSWKDVETAVRK